MGWAGRLAPLPSASGRYHVGMADEQGKGSALLATNDPARKCWTFLRDVLDREEAVPADPLAARNRLRELLIEAHATRPYKLMRMAVLSAGPGSIRGRIDAFVQCLRAEGMEIDHRVEAAPDAEDTRTLLVDPAWRSATNYIISRWAAMGDGHRTEARAAVYRELGTSTNEPVRAWLPEKCGVVPYLRARTKHILLEYYDRLERNLPVVSLNHMEDVYGLQLSDEGRFVRPFASERADADAGEPPEEAQERAAAPDDEEIRRVVDDTFASSPLSRGDEAEEERERIDRLIERYRGREGAGRPASFAVWPLCVFDPQFTPDLTADPAAVRASARALLARLAAVDADIAADLPTLLDLLSGENWDGRKPLVAHLPELADAAFAHRYDLAGEERRGETHDPSLPPSETDARALQLAAKIGQQLLTFSEDGQARNLADRAEDLARAPTARASRELAYDQVTIAEMLSAHAGTADPDSSERPDYLFLARATGSKLNPDLAGEALHQELRELFFDYLQILKRASPDMMEVAMHLEELEKKDQTRWDPGKQFLGGRLEWAAAAACPWGGRRELEAPPEVPVDPARPSRQQDEITFE